MIERALKLQKNTKESFFLWGPRQTGKSSLLRATYEGSKYIDLLKTEIYVRYLEKPQLLREELVAQVDKLKSPVVIDEIQKVPQLLNEVHWLIENKGIKFALCSSSARKVRKGGVNLLGGRAVRYELYGLTSFELKKDFNLNRILNHGYLPRHYLSSNAKRLIHSYISDYLKEEITQEGLTRNMPVFSNFLSIAALSDTEIVNYTNIARECGISSPTVKEHFQILVDTLLAKFLPSYTKRPKRRVILSPKFYFADVGVVNYLARRGDVLPGSELYGKAFENWIFHELSAYNSYKERYFDLSYWRLASGIEVDFIINNMEYAVEAKAKEKITSDDLNGLKEIIKDHNQIKKRIVVCLESEERLTKDGILILPVNSFMNQLWSGQLL